MRKIQTILLVSKFNNQNQSYSYASSFQKALVRLGYQVTVFNCKRNFLSFNKKQHDQLTGLLKPINNFFIEQLLIKQAITIKPDLIFLIKAENISHKTIKKLKQLTKSLIINFYPDNPFTFWNGNSNKNILLSLPLYDCFLIWSRILIEPLNAAGSNKTIYFPFAYDEEIFTHHEIKLLLSDNQQYKTDVAFIGTWDQERELWLTMLLEKMPYLNLTIWGNGWHQIQKDSPLYLSIKPQELSPKEMVKAFHGSKIVLNFIRKQNATAHNMRTFELLASKTFMLTQRTIEQTTYPFCEGENIECFDNIEELIKKIEFYLKNDNLREIIAQKGFALAQNFELSHRLSSFFNEVFV